MTRLVSVKLAAVALVLSAGLAHAQIAASCDAPHQVDKYQLLRRLSLDLRGRAPSYAEYQALDTQTTVPAATITSYLASADFTETMRRYHEDLFWPNVKNVALNNTNAQLRSTVLKTGGNEAWDIASVGRQNTWRNNSNIAGPDGLWCGDFEQTNFDPAFPGEFRPIPKMTMVGGKVFRQEGWRYVMPYWETDKTNPANRIKVCAYSAQETEKVTVGGKMVSCADPAAQGNIACGCGPNLRQCYGPRAQVADVITASLREQLSRSVDRVTNGSRPYSDLLLSTKIDENGPIGFWKKYLGYNYSLSRVYALADPSEPVPATADDFTAQDTWQQLDRGSPLHAGVVTAPAYLLRFQTNRSRANRFRIDFECQSFIPSTNLQSGCLDTGTDLTKRCYCQNCHQTLEPLAAGWGQVAEAGTTLLTDTAVFPRMNTACKGSGSAFCNRFYVTSLDGDNPGALLPYQYADAAHSAITAALAAGPQGEANKIMANGVFARCTVKRAFNYLMKRDIAADTADAPEYALLTQLANDFKDPAKGNYRFPWLMQQLVSLQQYRSVR